MKKIDISKWDNTWLRKVRSMSDPKTPDQEEEEEPQEGSPEPSQPPTSPDPSS